MSIQTRINVRGFTVVELLVSVAIIAILAVIAAPALGEYLATLRLKGATEELAADLQLARMESVQKNAQVTFTMAGTGYSITRGATTIKTVALTSGSSVSAGTAMVAVFDPVRAMATVTNGPNITMANSSTSRTLRVSLSTMGRITTCSPSGTVNGYNVC